MKTLPQRLQPFLKVAIYIGIFIGVCIVGLGVITMLGLVPPPPEGITGEMIVGGGIAVIAFMVLQLFVIKLLVKISTPKDG